MYNIQITTDVATDVSSSEHRTNITCVFFTWAHFVLYQMEAHVCVRLRYWYYIGVRALVCIHVYIRIIHILLRSEPLIYWPPLYHCLAHFSACIRTRSLIHTGINTGSFVLWPVWLRFIFCSSASLSSCHRRSYHAHCICFILRVCSIVYAELNVYKY